MYAIYVMNAVIAHRQRQEEVVVEKYDNVAGLQVRPVLRRFVEEEVLPGAGLQPEAFWPHLATIIADLAPRHRDMLTVREALQGRIDNYHRAHGGQPHDAAGYEQFLREIGYLVPAPAADAYKVATKNVDAEMAVVAGPQLVAPLSDAAAVRAATEARWGSLYQALLGGERGSFDAVRDGIACVRAFLDRAYPLAGGSHADAVAYIVEGGRLEVALADGSRRKLKVPGQFAGYTGPRHEPKSILLARDGLHLELSFDRDHAAGRRDAAGIADVTTEAVLSVVMDLDDTVAAADAEDKVAAYRTWLELIDGRFGGQASDRVFTAPAGGRLVLSGRPVMLLRHTSHDRLTDMVLDGEGRPVPEAIIDAAVTVASAVQDFRGSHAGSNSRTGSIYVVKPGMEGPDEVGLADLLFKHSEELVGLPKYTMKIGLVDEKRRTSLNLAACMSRVRDRTFLLKTVAAERIGDEIRTAMEAGPMPRLAEMEEAAWFRAYEANNVEIGIARNLPGRALMAKSMAADAEKAVPARAGVGAITVPTPLAATHLAMRCHVSDIASEQEGVRHRPRAQIGDLLAPPVAIRDYAVEEIAAELDGNLERLFSGMGPLIAFGASAGEPAGGRAALHAAGRHLANWLRHGVVDEHTVRAAMQRVAASIDCPAARLTFAAVEDLVFKAGGCVEAVLPLHRLRAKAGAA